jgi:hypothetical protein
LSEPWLAARRRAADPAGAASPHSRFSRRIEATDGVREKELPMTILEPSIYHFLPILLMLGMVALNHMIVHQRTERRYSIEAARLRAGLTAEMRVLVDLYAKNLELLETKAGYLLSTRSPVMVYRSNLGRITSLFEATVIEHLVNIFAQNERIEAVLAAHATSKGGLTYTLTADSKVDELKQMYLDTSRELDWACQALEGGGRLVKPLNHSLQWVSGLLQSPQPSP